MCKQKEDTSNNHRVSRTRKIREVQKTKPSNGNTSTAQKGDGK